MVYIVVLSPTSDLCVSRALVRPVASTAARTVAASSGDVPEEEDSAAALGFFSADRSPPSSDAPAHPAVSRTADVARARR